MRARAGAGGSILLVALACGPSLVPPPQQVDVIRLLERYPDTTLAELERGRTLYLSRCTSCHAPIAPGSLPAERWPEEVSEMSDRARLGDEESLVVKYLVAQAMRNQH